MRTHPPPKAKKTLMTRTMKNLSIDRRQAMIGAGASGLAALLPGSPLHAQEIVQEPTMAEALKTAIGDAKPIEGKVRLDLPEVAENGNTVPYSVTVEGGDAKAIHILAEKNPNPNVASFYFSPRSGKAQVSSRMRLGSTQNVVAIAQMKDGSVYMGKRTVKVTIGGCGG